MLKANISVPSKLKAFCCLILKYCIHITANCHWVSTAIQIIVSRLAIVSYKAKMDKAHVS